MDDTHHHDEDSDALASALGAIGAHHQDDNSAQHHFHHQLQQPDFSVQHKSQDDLDVNGNVDVDVDSQGLGEHEGIDVHALDIPVEGDDDLDLNLGSIGTPGLDVDDSDGGGHRGGYGRPPSIRKGGLSALVPGNSLTPASLRPLPRGKAEMLRRTTLVLPVHSWWMDMQLRTSSTPTDCA